MRNCLRSRVRFFCLFTCLLTCLVLRGSTPATAADTSADSAAVKKALSGHHMEVTATQLEQIAGGKDALITELLALRRDTVTPFVGVRAVKLLLPYSADSRVQTALTEDLKSSEFKGLAQAIALNLVTGAESGESKNVLARTALERSKTDKSFAPFVEPIKSSQDPEMKRIVSDVLTTAQNN